MKVVARKLFTRLMKHVYRGKCFSFSEKASIRWGSCADASVAHEVSPVEKVRAAGPMAANEDGAAAAARRW
jgi:hypothetical protein